MQTDILFHAGPSAGRPTPPRLAVCRLHADLPDLLETVHTEETDALRALGHTVVPVALAADAPLPEGMLALDAVETLAALTAAAAHPAGLAAAVGLAQHQRTMPRRTLLRAAARLAHIARAQGCTHIHAPAVPVPAAIAIAAARIARLTASFCGLGAVRAATEPELAPLLAAADLVAAETADLAAWFRRLAPDAHVCTIAAGVPVERLRPLPGPANGRLLAIGPLAPHADLSTVLAALARLPEARRPGLDVAGEGPLAEELAAQTHALGLGATVTWLGDRSADWIAAEAPRYQGFVTAGAARDGAALAVKGAMAMGLPLVAAALPRLREVADEPCGRFVPPGDAPALAEALAWLAGLAPEQRARHGAAARARAEQFFSLSTQTARLAAAIGALSA